MASLSFILCKSGMPGPFGDILTDKAVEDLYEKFTERNDIRVFLNDEDIGTVLSFHLIRTGGATVIECVGEVTHERYEKQPWLSQEQIMRANLFAGLRPVD